MLRLQSYRKTVELFLITCTYKQRMTKEAMWINPHLYQNNLEKEKSKTTENNKFLIDQNVSILNPKAYSTLEG